MKVKGFLAVLLFAALLLSGFACGGGAPGGAAEQIRDEAISAGADIATCQFDMDMTMDLRMAMGGETIEITMSVDGEGAIDEPGQKMYMHMDMFMEVPGEEDMQVSMEMYLVEDWVYMKMEMPGEPPTWMKSPMEAGDWEELDITSQQVNMLLDVEVELLGTETVDGTECYVLEVTPDLEKLWALMQSAGAEQGLPPELDVEELITDLSLRQWVAKDTYFPRKTAVNLTMVFTPESLGIPPGLVDEFDATADMTMTMTMHHIKEPVTIELPPEAEEAEEVPMP